MTSDPIYSFSPQRNSRAPTVKPAPTDTMRSKSPRFNRRSHTASLRDTELLRRRQDDATVGLMRDEQIDAARIDIVALENPAAHLCGVADRELEDGAAILLHEMQALLHRLGGCRP